MLFHAGLSGSTQSILTSGNGMIISASGLGRGGVLVAFWPPGDECSGIQHRWQLTTNMHSPILVMSPSSHKTDALQSVFSDLYLRYSITLIFFSNSSCFVFTLFIHIYIYIRSPDYYIVMTVHFHLMRKFCIAHPLLVFVLFLDVILMSPTSRHCLPLEPICKGAPGEDVVPPRSSPIDECGQDRNVGV